MAAMKMKIQIALLICLFSSQAWGQEDSALLFSVPSERPPPQDSNASVPDGASLQQKTSFSTLLLRDQRTFDFLEARMPKGCAYELRKLYQSGNTLNSITLAKAAIPVLDVEYVSREQDARFFHWTSEEAYRTLTKLFQINGRGTDGIAQAPQQTAYNDVFLYLRATPERNQNRHTPASQSMWAMQLYAAEDSKSSANYGNRLIEIEFSRDAKVLKDLDPAWPKALRELKEKFPDVVNVCRLEDKPQSATSYGCGADRTPIYFIVAEDSGIDLINYYGCGANRYGQYFQIISPKRIVNTNFH